MSDYITEQEQIQQIKQWLKQYGFTIVLGVALAFAITSGWRYWQNYQNNILLHASGVYDEMLALRAQDNSAGTLVQAKKLLSHYPKTPYAQMAAFMLARDAILNKHYTEATQQFDWIMDHTKESAIHQIARLRKARLLIADNKPQEALVLLQTIDDKAFNGLTEEIRGDAHLAMKDTEAARKAYTLALTQLPNAELMRPILQMKLDNLATSS